MADDTLKLAPAPAAPEKKADEKRLPRLAPKLGEGLGSWALAPWDVGAVTLALVRAGVPFALSAGSIPAQQVLPATPEDLTSYDWQGKAYVVLRGPDTDVRQVLDGLQDGYAARLQDEFEFRTAQARLAVTVGSA